MKTLWQSEMDVVMPRKGHSVLGTWIDALFWEDAIDQLIKWGTARESRYVCICNVHSVVTATRDAQFRSALSGADMTTSDGAPIAWALRRLGFPAQERIAGPDLMWRYLREAERLRLKVFLYGSKPETLAKLRASIDETFPGLMLAGMRSPPFNAVTLGQDEADVDEINASGANVVFVGLGCPKQEKWMAAHRGRINAVMVGVGAAFDFHSGTLKRAPLWWQHHGLEWLHRLASEPRRLAPRYLVTNTLFVIGFSWQLIVEKFLRRRGH